MTAIDALLPRCATVAGLALLTSACAATDESLPRSNDAHDRAVGIMRQLANRDMAGTDTFATWAPDLKLFHTASYAADSSSAGLLRADGMVGTAVVRQGAEGPTAFDVVWTTPGAAPNAVRGTRAGNQIRITGSRDTTFAVPQLPWAVVDHGMESLLAPLMQADSARAARRLVLFRPYALRWDTLDVTVERVSGVVIARAGTGRERFELVFSPRRLLWMRYPEMNTERRPLEGTAAFADYERVRAALGQTR